MVEFVKVLSDLEYAVVMNGVEDALRIQLQPKKKTQHDEDAERAKEDKDMPWEKMYYGLLDRIMMRGGA